MTTRSLTILNTSGDVTIIWDEASDERMTAIIQKKMDEGMTFFIVEPVAGGLAPPKKTKLADPEQALKNRALVIDDEDIATFVGEGGAEVIKRPAKTKTVKKASSAKEAATSQSVGVRQRKGG